MAALTNAKLDEAMARELAGVEAKMREAVCVEASCEVCINVDGQIVLQIKAGLRGEGDSTSEKVILRAASLRVARQIAEAQGYRIVPACPMSRASDAGYAVRARPMRLRRGAAPTA